MRELGCTTEAARRAVAAAIVSEGDISEAAALLYEPEEVFLILHDSTALPKYRCFHCGRGFRTFGGYQRHSDLRRSTMEGVCQLSSSSGNSSSVREPAMLPRPMAVFTVTGRLLMSTAGRGYYQGSL